LGPLVIHVAECNDVFGLGTSSNVASRLAARSNRNNIQLLVRRFVAEHLQRWLAAEARKRNGSGEQSTVKEMSSGHLVMLHNFAQLPTLNDNPAAVTGVIRRQR